MNLANESQNPRRLSCIQKKQTHVAVHNVSGAAVSNEKKKIGLIIVILDGVF